MSYKVVKQILKELSPEQTEFLKTRKYEGRQTMNQWLELFHNLVILDTHGDKARGKANGFWITSIVLFVLSLFVSIAFPLFFIVSGILFLSFVYFLVTFIKLKKMDLSNHLREQIYPFLGAIKHDVHKKEKIKMKLDFSDPINANYLTETIPAKGRSYPRIKTTYYEHPYFSILLTMEDGAEIDFQSIDLIRKRNVTKLSQSGKVKSKVKYKIKHSADLKIAFPKSNYNYQTSKTGQYTDSAEYHQIRIKTKAISSTLGDIAKPEQILSVFASAYQSVMPL